MADFEPDTALSVEDSVAGGKTTEKVVAVPLRAPTAYSAGLAVLGSVARKLRDARAIVVRTETAHRRVRRGGNAAELTVHIEEPAPAVRAAATRE
jgi:hypothetical protein